jgi:hypothetical protein
VSGYTIINDNSSWNEVAGENNTYEATLVCPGGRTALSVGVNGTGRLNNVISMFIFGGQNDSGYFRVRVQGGSQAQDVTAQLVCAQVS